MFETTLPRSLLALHRHIITFRNQGHPRIQHLHFTDCVELRGRGPIGPPQEDHLTVSVEEGTIAGQAIANNVGCTL